MKPENKLLRRIAAIPADEKLPVSRFARELNCSAAVVISMIAQLGREGRLDPTTLRPPAASSPQAADHEGAVQHAKAAAPSSERAGDALLAEIDDYCRRTGTPAGYIGKLALNHPGFVPLLRKRGTLNPATADIIRAVLAKHPGGISREQSLHREAAAATEREARLSVVAPATFERNADSSAERLTGEQLYQQLRVAAEKAGVPFSRYVRPAFASADFLRHAKHPTRKTIERARALMAGEIKLGELSPNKRFQGQRAEEATASSQQVALLRDINETRHEERDRRVREVVAREAEERAARRHQARRLTVAHPLDAGDAVSDALLDRIDTASDRRQRELEELPTASSVLRRAQRDWPDQCDKVKALAAELGVTLGEAWRRVIGAGVDCLTDPEAA